MDATDRFFLNLLDRSKLHDLLCNTTVKHARENLICAGTKVPSALLTVDIRCSMIVRSCAVRMLHFDTLAVLTTVDFQRGFSSVLYGLDYSQALLRSDA